MKKQLKLLLVDFDGVMSNDRFYNGSTETETQLGAQAIKHIFTSENIELLNDWMRGGISYQKLHDIIQSRSGIDARKLDSLLEASVQRMSINHQSMGSSN